jgi:hypothetical protein
MFLRPLIKPNIARRYMSSSNNNEIEGKLDLILSRTKNISDMQFVIFIIGMSSYIIQIARTINGK